jgi:hypothetical protein
VISDRDLPFLVAHLALNAISPLGRLDPHQELLYGTLVSSAHRLRDADGRPGIFFLFPDVSVRQRGHYCLNITLVNIAG